MASPRIEKFLTALDRSGLRWLVGFIVLGRIACSFSISRFAHPDEWYQTVEMARIFWGKDGTISQEVFLHLRNLTWPLILSFPMGVSDLLFPGYPDARFSLTHLFVSALDLLLVVSVLQYLSKRGLEKRWLFFAAAICFTPVFTWMDQVRLSIEHASSIAFWLAVWAWTRRNWLAVGFGLAATGLIRYPSVLLSVGFFLALLTTEKPKDLAKVLMGAGLGILLFGVADWVAYGRPYESLYMYVQYNLLTGLSHQIFGSQPSTVYLEFLAYRWIGKLVWVPVIALVLVGFWHRASHDFKNRFRDPVLFAGMFYVLGHMGVSHKEQRFMAPAELIFLAYSLTGLPLFLKTSLSRERGLAILVSSILFINIFPSLRVWQGEWLRERRESMRVFGRLHPDREFERVCEVWLETFDPVTEGNAFMRTRLPDGTDYRIAHFSREKPDDTHWLETRKDCAPSRDRHLIFFSNRDQPVPSAFPSGCATVAVGFIDSLFSEAVAEKIRKGKWLLCEGGQRPGSITSRAFTGFIDHFPRIEQLPRLFDVEGVKRIADQMLR